MFRLGRYISICLTALLMTMADGAWGHGDYRVEDVPNPRLRCAGCYVEDVAGVLSADVVRGLNGRLAELERSSSAEVAVVILPSIEGDDETSFAYELASGWGIGKRGRNNGLLFLYVVDIRAMRFETGTGLEGVLPDAYLNALLNERIFPLMREGRPDEAFALAVGDISDRLSSEEAVSEMLLATDSPRVRYVNWVMWYLMVSLLVFVVSLWWAYGRMSRIAGENNVRYAAIDRVMGGVVLPAWVFPLPTCFLYMYLRRQRRLARMRPMECEKCAGRMRLLSESAEDVYLTKGQQVEEMLKSVDYDVWMCPSCDEVKILPYVGTDSKFTSCPVCGAKAYSLVSHNVVVAATTLSDGRGEDVYECRSCRYRRSAPFRVPRIVVAPTVPTSGRGGGFGGFGGGFGGGSFGGGGAGGRF